MNDIEWKPIKGYEGLYLISNTGIVKSIAGRNRRKDVYKEKILKAAIGTTGYWQVSLAGYTGKRTFKVHRLVAINFIDNPLNLREVNHKDLNKLNNSVENLEWVSRQQNVTHSIEKQARTDMYYFTEEEKNKCLTLYNNRKTYAQIGQELNISKHSVRRICRTIYPEKKIRPQKKYNFKLADMFNMVEQGYSNKEIAKILNCSSNLVARRKYQLKNNLINKEIIV